MAEHELIDTDVAILCVQLEGDPFQSNPELTETCKIRHVSFLDLPMILKNDFPYKLVIIQWDGLRGKSKSFIYSVKEIAPEVPVFILLSKHQYLEAKLAKKTKADRVYRFPLDVLQIHNFLYDMLEHEKVEEIDSLDEIKVDTGIIRPDFGINNKVDEIPFEKIPLGKAAASTTTMLQLIQTRFAKFEAFNKEVQEFDKESDLVRDYFVAYHPDETFGAGLKRQLKSAGFINVRIVTSTAALFEQLWTRDVAGVLIWYDIDIDDGIEIVRELNEIRDIQHFAVMVLCPGESAVERFKTFADDLIVDGIVVPEKNNINYRSKIMSAVSSSKDFAMASQVLYGFRYPWRSENRANRKPMSLQEINQMSAELSSLTSSPYWAEAERGLHLFFAGKLDEASKIAKDLQVSYRNTLDPSILLATTMVKTSGVKEASEWLYQAAVQHRNLNLEKAYQICSLLLRWKAFQTLEKFLGHWFEREDLPKSHQFHYHQSQVWEVRGEHRRAQKCIVAALEKLPTRYDYIAAYAENLLHLRMYPQAVTAWKLTLKAFRCHKLQVYLGLAKAYTGARRPDEASKAIQEVLRRDPSNREAIALKAKIAS